MSEATITYCANHPTRETNLRCNNCGKYICAKCAVRTPTGYRCPECVRGQQKTFETARNLDYVLAFSVAVVLSAIGALIASRIGFFTLLLAPAAGGVIAEAVRAATGRRRSPRLFLLTAIAVVVGGAPFFVEPLVFFLNTGNMGALLNILWPLIYSSFASSAAFYRLSGIELRR